MTNLMELRRLVRTALNEAVMIDGQIYDDLSLSEAEDIVKFPEWFTRIYSPYIRKVFIDSNSLKEEVIYGMFYLNIPKSNIDYYDIEEDLEKLSSTRNSLSGKEYIKFSYKIDEKPRYTSVTVTFESGYNI